MKRLAGVVAVVSLALAGCGGSVCQDTADSYDTLNEKAKPCGATVVNPITEAEINTCEDNLDKCSDSDKKSLEDFNDCVGDLAKCSPGGERTFDSAVDTCETYLDKISDTCTNAAFSSARRSVARFRGNVSR